MLMVDTQYKFSKKVLYFILGAWSAFYLISFLGLLSHNHAIEKTGIIFGNMSDFVEIMLDSLLIVFSCKVVSSVGRVKNKKLFLYLLISFFFLFLTDLSYVVLYDVLQIQDPHNCFNLFYFLPFLCYLILQIMFWYNLIWSEIVKKSQSWIPNSMFILGSFVMLVFIVNSSWRISYFSYVGVYELVTGCIGITLFYLAALGTICSRFAGISFLAYSSMLIIATNFWEKYLFQNGTLSKFDYSDPFWCLALIFGVIGLYYFLKDKRSDDRWFYSLEHIKSQVSLGAFLFTMATLIIFVFLGYVFGFLKEKSEFSLPFVIMAYTLGSLQISNYFGKKLESLFLVLKDNISAYMKNPKSVEKDKTKFFTKEFVFLQNFIFKMFEKEQERNEERQAIADLAAQVAHDIRSPVATILMFSKEYLGLPESQRMILRNSANRIQNIANGLLNYYKSERSDEKKISKNLVMELLSSIFAEKEVEYQSAPIKFICDINVQAAFCFIEVNRIEFERMISNLINNSVESFDGEGIVRLLVEKHDNKLLIKICDNGKGMSQDVLNKILSGNQVTSKKTGYGLGIPYVRSIIKKYNATLDIKSVLNTGTETMVAFPVIQTPPWVAKEIELHSDDIIIVLDDDPSIHDVWDNLFSSSLACYSEMRLYHCRTSEQCLEYIRSTEERNRQKIILLSDYELLRQGVTGLDLIEISDVQRSILVTSHYDKYEIIRRAILKNTKILPKVLTPDVTIRVAESAPEDSSVLTYPDLIIIENAEELADILAFLYQSKNKSLVSYVNPYDFLRDLHKYDKRVKICFDYDLDLPINGFDLAQVVHDKGFKNLYMASGYSIDDLIVPAYLTMLEDKMSILKL